MHRSNPSVHKCTLRHRRKPHGPRPPRGCWLAGHVLLSSITAEQAQMLVRWIEAAAPLANSLRRSAAIQRGGIFCRSPTAPTCCYALTRSCNSKLTTHRTAKRFAMSRASAITYTKQRRNMRCVSVFNNSKGRVHSCTVQILRCINAPYDIAGSRMARGHPVDVGSQGMCC